MEDSTTDTRITNARNWLTRLLQQEELFKLIRVFVVHTISVKSGTLMTFEFRDESNTMQRAAFDDEAEEFGKEIKVDALVMIINPGRKKMIPHGIGILQRGFRISLGPKTIVVRTFLENSSMAPL